MFKHSYIVRLHNGGFQTHRPKIIYYVTPRVSKLTDNYCSSLSTVTFKSIIMQILISRFLHKNAIQPYVLPNKC